MALLNSAKVEPNESTLKYYSGSVSLGNVTANTSITRAISTVTNNTIAHASQIRSITLYRCYGYSATDYNATITVYNDNLIFMPRVSQNNTYAQIGILYEEE